MSNSESFEIYLQELQQNLSTGAATEHTYRPALKSLIEMFDDGVLAINEPKRVECGAPDYIITRANIPVGYIEAKDVGANLDAAERSEQMGRYRDSLNNLILTDYLEFRWYVEGEHRETAQLAIVTKDGKVKKSKDGVQAVASLFQKFFAQKATVLGRPRELAQRMAALARMIRELIEETFKRESEKGVLHAQLKAFRETLISDLTPAHFADMYAQTITYGLFAARIRAPMGEDFSREKAAWNLPRTNPFLRKLFNEIAGPDLDDRIAWLVDNLAHLLERADMAEILRDFGKRTRQEDAVVHFYETFLSAYDPKMRQARGVYYTPEPVVAYIVRSIDYILKSRFGRTLGLADTNTLILDPAVGTATFPYFVIQQIYKTLMAMGQAGAWSDYVEKHLLPRIFGFELLMAPYAVAHTKLGILLQETGYDFSGNQRLGIYLTNALEKVITQPEFIGFAGFITEEANAATEIKEDKPIMVVLGNPPYSVSSANKGEHIERLMKRYKDAVRGEQNIQPLSDDYIKFIRFAHDRIERTGYGVIGMITNHSYLSGLIHRGMREELMKTFDEIYVLNLHGNALMGETAPDGSPDENVFDIRQGVAISLFVKKQGGEGLCEVKYAELWGLRAGKYRYLAENDVSTTEWQKLEPRTTSNFFLVPKEFDLLDEYERGWSIIDTFQNYSAGFETGRDCELITFAPDKLISLMGALANPKISDEDIADRYGIRNTSGWSVSSRRHSVIAEGFREEYLRLVSYRPFDKRYTYYHGFLRRAQFQNLRHLCQSNISLVTSRIIKGEDPKHVFVSVDPVEKIFLSPKTSNNAFIFPLYFYITPEDTGNTLPTAEKITREPNLSPNFIAAVKEKLGLEFVMDGKGDLQTTFGPEDILHYAYAVFHSQTYRKRYAEFLKIDFPRLPITSDRALFKALADKGEELVAMHLMESPTLNQLTTSFPVAGSNEVVNVRYVEPYQDKDGKEIPGRIHINKTQYFEGIEPVVWKFQIGGYQVLQKWLKDRKGRNLSFDDLFHYQKIVVALKETMRLMKEIDSLIPAWPIE